MSASPLFNNVSIPTTHTQNFGLAFCLQLSLCVLVTGNFCPGTGVHQIADALLEISFLFLPNYACPSTQKTPQSPPSLRVLFFLFPFVLLSVFPCNDTLFVLLLADPTFRVNPEEALTHPVWSLAVPSWGSFPVVMV